MKNSKRIVVFTLLVFTFISNAQTIPVNRVYDWKNAGLTEPLPAYSTTLNMQTAGADITGVIPCDGIFLTTINQCTVTGQSYTIFFPTGIYTFTNTIQLKSNVKLEGVGISTHLIFTNPLTCINVQGSTTSAVSYSITQNAIKNNRYILSNANTPTVNWNAGQFFILKQKAATLVTSNWAYNSVGQFFKINSINADTLKLNHELRKDYAIIDTISMYPVYPIENVGIKCMKITRRNTTVGSYPTIQFLYAYNSYVEGIEMDSCFFSHITLESSGNCQVSGSYFHDAYDYGGNGRGYGVAVQFNSTDHKIENNIFDHQRHSVLMQAGANGNVVDYNYSINPFWTGTFLPANSAGDMVLHGNYVYANLFEGNTCQHMVIDNSHGINGPDNLFFRNRAQGYGIFMNSGPASNNQLFVGNEITSTTPLQGMYSLQGTGHFEYANKKQGTVTPVGTGTLTDVSYCYASQPAFLATNTWPVIGIPNVYNTGTIPAQLRNGTLTKIECNALTTQLPKNNLDKEYRVFPNPTTGTLKIQNYKNTITEIQILNLLGAIIYKPLVSEIIDLSSLVNGVYVVVLKENKNTVHTQKIVVSK